MLVVDDNATSRRLLERQLSVWGMSCDTAVDGNDVLPGSDARPGPGYGLVLLDDRMPNMTARGAGRRIDPLEIAGSPVPIVLLTSSKGGGSPGRRPGSRAS